MAKGRPAVILELPGEQIEHLLALRDDVQVVAAIMPRLDNSLDRLRDELTHEIRGVREETSEIRAEINLDFGKAAALYEAAPNCAPCGVSTTAPPHGCADWRIKDEAHR